MLISGTNSDTRHKPSVYDAPGTEAFELLNFDNRGMGQSSSPGIAPTMQAYAEDAAKLLDYIGWEKTCVIGVSFGGMIAQHLALHYPQKISRLVLCCTSSGGNGGSSYPLHELQDLTAQEYAAAMVKLMNITHDDTWQAAHPEQAKSVYNLYWQGADATFNNPVKHAAMKTQFAARAAHDTYDALKKLPIPTLVAGGEYDGVAPPANQQALADIIPNTRLQIFKGGHMFMKEDPKAWPSILDFLKAA